IHGLPGVPLRETNLARLAAGPATRAAARKPPMCQEAMTMTSIRSSIRRILTPAAAKAGVVAAGGAAAAIVGLTAAPAPASAATPSALAKSFSFQLKPSSAAITACLPNAGGHVTITPQALNDKMVVSLHGMPANTGFDLFVIQQPTAPFGVSWYQSDIQTNDEGNGSATVRGIFDA